MILSGGVVGSPQLLLLSGVGPADHLEEVGVPLIHHLPGVGQNFQDHIATLGKYYFRRAKTTFESLLLSRIFQSPKTGNPGRVFPFSIISNKEKAGLL